MPGVDRRYAVEGRLAEAIESRRRRTKVECEDGNGAVTWKSARVLGGETDFRSSADYGILARNKESRLSSSMP